MEPLASRLRPDSLQDFLGQDHLLGQGKPLRIAFEKRQLFSFILWGPPGSGKTTVARMYAKAVEADFYELSAVDAGKDDIRKVLGTQRNIQYRAKVLFIDEIHRFNKTQQDFLLPFVERGDITLVGATTENPSFELVNALLSRCQVFILKSHESSTISSIIDRALQTLGHSSIDNDAKDWLVSYASGDARKALTTLETTGRLYGEVTLKSLQDAVQVSGVRYDKKGEEHYDTVSAFIKSMRASQSDAALYYLARMVEGGEDPVFIARRMVVFASEDIGLAQPTALVVANAVFDAVRSVGYPEASINLAHGVVYLSTCKKDRRAYDAYQRACEDVRKHGNVSIPLKLRNAPTSLMRTIGYGKGYEMYDTDSFLPEGLEKKKYLT